MLICCRMPQISAAKIWNLAKEENRSLLILSLMNTVSLITVYSPLSMEQAIDGTIDRISIRPMLPNDKNSNSKASYLIVRRKSWFISQKNNNFELLLWKSRAVYCDIYIIWTILIQKYRRNENFALTHETFAAKVFLILCLVIIRLVILCLEYQISQIGIQRNIT